MKWEMRCETCIHFDACKFIMERYTGDTLNEDGVACSNYRPKKFGKWVKNTDHGGWRCSVCCFDNYMAYVDYDDIYELQDFYCPHCGSKMEDLDEEGRQCSHITEVKEVIHAQWLDHHGFDKCSACGYLGEGITNFCPNCGADMRGENNI